MAYNFQNDLNNIKYFSNYCKKDKIEQIDNTKYSIEMLINGSFNPNTGFLCDGSFSFTNSDKNKTEKLKSINFNKNNFKFIYDKTEVPKISYSSDNEIFYTSLRLNVEEEQNIRSTNSSYLKDLDYLYEDYFYVRCLSLLEKYLPPEKEKNLPNILNLLSEYNLSNEVSHYLQDLVEVYNQSYFSHLEEIKQNFSNTVKDSSEFRYSLCTESDFFKENVQIRLNLFDAQVSNKILSKSNVREDKTKSYLDFVLENEKILEGIVYELEYKSNMKIPRKNHFDDNVKSRICKETKKICNEFKDKGLITSEEKEKIKKFENSNFKGISIDERVEYETLINNIKDRYSLYISTFKEQNRILSINGFTDDWLNFNHEADKTQSIIDSKDKNSKLSIYIDECKADWDTFLKLKRDDLNAALIHEQISNLEKVESMYAQKDNNLGVNKIDFDKLSVIKKIDSLDSFNEPIRISQIESLINNDIPTLENIVYSTEIFSGIKNNFWSRIQEADKQIVFGNQHYHYLDGLSLLQLFKDNLTKAEDDLVKADLSNLKELFVMDNVFLEGDIPRDVQKKYRQSIKDMSNKDLSDFIHLCTNNIDGNFEAISDFMEKKFKIDIKDDYKEDFIKVINSQLKTFEGSKIEDKININKVEQYLSFQRILDEMNNTISIELKDTEEIKEHITLKNRHKDSELAFGFTFEDISTDGKIDLIKTLTQLKELDKKFQGLTKSSVEASNVAENMNYIKTHILKGLVESKEIRASERDLTAYEALCNARNLTFDTEKIKENRDEISSIDEKLFEMKLKRDELKEAIGPEDINSEDNKNMLYKIKNFKKESKVKELKNLNKEIKELEDKKELLQKEVSGEIKDIQAKLKDLSTELKLSLEDSTMKETLSEEDKQLIGNIKENNSNSLKIKLTDSLDRIVEEINSSYKEKLNEKEVESEDLKYKMMVLLSAIKDYPEQKIIDCLNSENQSKQYLSNLLQESFKDVNKDNITESLTNFYKTLDSEGVISKQDLRKAIDSYLKENQNLVPLDIPGSNNFYNYLLKNEYPYNLEVSNSSGTEIINFTSKEVCILDKFLNSNKDDFISFSSNENENNNEVLESLEKILGLDRNSNEFKEKLDEINEKIENVLKLMKEEECIFDVKITKNCEDFIRASIQKYGDSSNVLIVPQGESIQFSKNALVSINASNNEMDLTNLKFKLEENTCFQHRFNEKFEIENSSNHTTNNEEVQDFEIKVVDMKEISNSRECNEKILEAIQLTDSSEKDNLKDLIQNYICDDNNLDFVRKSILNKENLESKFEDNTLDVVNLLKDVLNESETDNIKSVLKENGYDSFSAYADSVITEIKEEVKQKENEEEQEENKSVIDKASDFGSKVINKAKKKTAGFLRNVASVLDDKVDEVVEDNRKEDSIEQSNQKDERQVENDTNGKEKPKNDEIEI